jgi:hypothetical protein
MNIKMITILLMVLTASDMRALIIGSNGTVSVESYVTFPESDITSNEIRGFAMMANGFALENSNTELLFSGFFPLKNN